MVLLHTDALGDDFINQRVEAIQPQTFEHIFHFLWARGDMAVQKSILGGKQRSIGHIVLLMAFNR